MKHKTHRTTRT